MKSLCCFLLIVLTILIFHLLFILLRKPSLKRGEEKHTIKPKKVTKIAIATLVRKPVDFPLWLRHHRDMGVTNFFIRVEDTPGLEDYLKTQKDIEYELGFSSRENNYETLQKRQLEFVNKCLEKCIDKDIKWIFHIDCDELLEGDIDFLNGLSEEVKTIKLENAEAMYNEEEETCFSAKDFMMCSKGAPCRSYVNGKSGGRCESGVHLAGPHDFYYNGGAEKNYNVPFDQLHVLHFDSCSFGGWIEKFKHLSKTDGQMPFSYYNNSIEKAKDAFSVYRESTKVKDIDKQLIYNKRG